MAFLDLNFEIFGALEFSQKIGFKIFKLHENVGYRPKFDADHEFHHESTSIFRLYTLKSILL